MSERVGVVSTCGRDQVLFFRTRLALPRMSARRGSGQSNWETGDPGHTSSGLPGAEQLGSRTVSILGHPQGGVLPVPSASSPLLRVCAGQ